jgi:hypothetical protein
MKDFLVLTLWILATLILSFWGNWALGFVSSLVMVPVFGLFRGKALILAFLAGAISWSAPAFYLDQGNTQLLSTMVSQLLALKNPFWLVLITGLLGGIGVSLTAWLATGLFPARKM